MSYRDDIAEALSTADGVTGYAYRPTATKPGDAWPLSGPWERSEGLTFIRTWRVMVLLPQDDRAASDWADDHVEALVDALLPVGFVDRIEFVPSAAEGGDQFALQITMRS